MKEFEPSSRSKATKDIISIGSFMEVLVLNHYVLVRKILGKLSKLQDEDAQNNMNIQEPRKLWCWKFNYFRLQPVLQNEESMLPKRRLFLTTGDSLPPGMDYFISVHPGSNIRFSALFLDKEDKSSF
ncbi:hypothetical protein Tco_1136421 [Tanacetum coccineum]